MEAREGALLGMADTAAALGVTERRLRGWIASGDAPRSRRIGKRRYFRRVDVEAFVDGLFADAATEGN
ncbi:MAG: helix-turn-helix domain-containing protein [Mobilicoccus sp.]|nr:helix-turn-helix domain-containing protein [Mobilicoccus sp.]